MTDGAGMSEESQDCSKLAVPACKLYCTVAHVLACILLAKDTRSHSIWVVNRFSEQPKKVADEVASNGVCPGLSAACPEESPGVWKHEAATKPCAQPHSFLDLIRCKGT